MGRVVIFNEIWHFFLWNVNKSINMTFRGEANARRLWFLFLELVTSLEIDISKVVCRERSEIWWQLWTLLPK